MEGSIRPTAEEVRAWIMTTVNHVINIEYYLTRLQVGSEDPERPHDIVGPGNKFEWPAIVGFAVQYRKGIEEAVAKKMLQSALTFHRTQYHHRMFNEPRDGAPEDAMKLGATDAICSLLERRDYQGGQHLWPEIEVILAKNPLHKLSWLKLVMPEMRKISSPIIQIHGVDDFVNPGISSSTEEIIRVRVQEALKYLERDMKYPASVLRQSNS